MNYLVDQDLRDYICTIALQDGTHDRTNTLTVGGVWLHTHAHARTPHTHTLILNMHTVHIYPTLPIINSMYKHLYTHTNGNKMSRFVDPNGEGESVQWWNPNRAVTPKHPVYLGARRQTWRYLMANNKHPLYLQRDLHSEPTRLSLQQQDFN